MTEETHKHQVFIPALIAVVLLVIALANGLPYGYYTFLRWVVTAAAGYVAWVAHEREDLPWMWAFGAIALLFNPIAPVYLDKEIWTILDIVVAVLFVSVAITTRRPGKTIEGELQ